MVNLKNPAKLNMSDIPVIIQFMDEREQFFKDRGISFPAEPSTDGAYHIAVPHYEERGERHHIKSKDLETLKIKVYLYLTTGTTKVTKSKEKITFAEVFYQALERENRVHYRSDADLAKHRKTEQRHRSQFKRFFGHTKLPAMAITKITAEDLERICRKNIEKYKLKHRAVEGYRTELNEVFNEAVRCHYIASNPAQDVFWKGLYKEAYPETALENRAHTDAELDRIMQRCYWLLQARKTPPTDDRLFKKLTKCDPAFIRVYALIFNILVACRRAELTALKWTDITADGLIIFKRFQTRDPQTKELLISEQLKSRTEGVTRPVALTPELTALLGVLRQTVNAYFPETEWLFPSDRTTLGCIGLNDVYNLYKDICGELGFRISREFSKGTHSFRRNKATTMSNNGADLQLISDLLGNSPKTLISNYRLTDRSAKQALRYQ